MTKILPTLVALSLFACAGPRPYAPTVPDSLSKRVEQRELPPDPAKEKLPSETPSGDWVMPLERGECLDERGRAVSEATVPCPAKSGVAVSEERAYRDGLFRIRYTELRKTFEADRQVWSAHRELYEERLKLADKAIHDLQPGWWDRNKLEVGLIGGTVIGIVTSVAILYVMDEVN